MKMKNKTIIRLTESDLKSIILETVKSIIKENKSFNIHNLIFISYGTNNYDPNMIKQVDVNSHWGRIHNKPHGGLWASPVSSVFGWADFCNSEAFSLKTLNKHFIFKLKPNANICIINDINDLTNNSIYDKELGKYVLDIKRIVNEYDGIYLTNNGAVKLHNVDYKLNINDMNSWDIESICIFNPNAIEPIEENAFEKASYHKYEKPLYGQDDEHYYYGFDNLKDRKQLQIDADFERYRNTNVEDSRKLFKGKHPSILAQQHGNSKDAKLARKFNGTIKSGMK